MPEPLASTAPPALRGIPGPFPCFPRELWKTPKRKKATPPGKMPPEVSFTVLLSPGLPGLSHDTALT